MRFSETVPTTVIDWKKTLSLIIAGRCSFAREAWLTKKAMNWATCACGQLDASLPHRLAGTGIPEDEPLFRMGLYFAMLMHERNFKEALETVLKIHDRSDQLGYPVPEELERGDPFMMMDDLPDMPVEPEMFPAYRQPLTVNMHWMDEEVEQYERARARWHEVIPPMMGAVQMMADE